MTAPDLRTAARAVCDAEETLERIGVGAISADQLPTTYTTLFEAVDVLRAALAAEATEPPPDALAHLTQRLDLATDHTDGDGATLLLALHFPGLDPDTTDPDALADEVAGNCGSSVEVSGIPVPQWLSPGAVAAVRELLALPAALGSAPNPEGADEPHRARIEIEWHPSASIGERAAVKRLLESKCAVLMDTLLDWDVVDPAVSLSMDPVGDDRRAAAVGVPDEPGDDGMAACRVVRRLLDGWHVIRGFQGREWHGPNGELEATSASDDEVLDRA